MPNDFQSIDFVEKESNYIFYLCTYLLPRDSLMGRNPHFGNSYSRILSLLLEYIIDVQHVEHENYDFSRVNNNIYTLLIAT